MKPLFIVCAVFSALVLCGKETTLLVPCEDFTVIGKSSYNEFAKQNLSCGKAVTFGKYRFSLSQEVDEFHCTPFKADLNNDGRTDYILQVAGPGNGRLFGLCDIYIFVSSPDNAKSWISFGHISESNGKKFRFFYMKSYGIDAGKVNGRLLLKGTSLSGDCRTLIEHYYAFDKDGWMKEVAVKLLAE